MEKGKSHINIIFTNFLCREEANQMRKKCFVMIFKHKKFANENRY